MGCIRKFKLEELCLPVILENLDKYIYSNHVPEKHIDFLLRCYSERLYRGLDMDPEDYQLWFLNPHVKKIKLDTVSERILSRLQVVGSGITSLSLYCTEVSEDVIISIISHIPHVTYLDLSNTLCSDKTVLYIQNKCLDLITLNLYKCGKVRDLGVKYLFGSNLPLRNLNLYGTNIKRAGLQNILKGMPLLECLRSETLISALYKIHQELEKAREIMHFNLTELIFHYAVDQQHFDEYYYCDLERITSACVTLCPNIKKLRIVYDRFNEGVLQICSKLNNLEDLKINVHDEDSGWFPYSHERDYLVPFTSNTYNLFKLSLCNAIISIESLQCCKNVKHLHLQRIYFEEFAEEKITLEENKLDILEIGKSTFKHTSDRRAILHLLSVSKNVTHLHLYENKEVPKEMLDIILDTMKGLQCVRFYDLPVESTTLVKFFELSSLKSFTQFSNDDGSHNGNFVEEYDFKEQPCTLSWYYVDEEDDLSEISDTGDFYDEDESFASDFSYLG